MSPSELLATIVAERRALEVATLPTESPRYRETWRRLRYVIDQARAWSEAEHGSLRDFLDWARRQAEEEERANEIVLPERDVDAIRILTIHAAKGLEFPVVVLSGLANERRNDAGRVVWPDDGPPEISLGAGARSAGWDDAAEPREAHALPREPAAALRGCHASREPARRVRGAQEPRGWASRRPDGPDPSGAVRVGRSRCVPRRVDEAT